MFNTSYKKNLKINDRTAICLFYTNATPCLQSRFKDRKIGSRDIQPAEAIKESCWISAKVTGRWGQILVPHLDEMKSSSYKEVVTFSTSNLVLAGDKTVKMFVYSQSQTSRLRPLEQRWTRGCHGLTTVSAKSITTVRRQQDFNAGPHSNPHGDTNKNNTKP